MSAEKLNLISNRSYILLFKFTINTDYSNKPQRMKAK